MSGRAIGSWLSSLSANRRACPKPGLLIPAIEILDSRRLGWGLWGIRFGQRPQPQAMIVTSGNYLIPAW